VRVAVAVAVALPVRLPVQLQVVMAVLALRQQFRVYLPLMPVVEAVAEEPLLLRVRLVELEAQAAEEEAKGLMERRLQEPSIPVVEVALVLMEQPAAKMAAPV
jgi:hypothetical protein